MADATHEQAELSRDADPAIREQCALPSLSNAEREFWRRAVAIERARQCRGRPTPFPFQEA